MFNRVKEILHDIFYVWGDWRVAIRKSKSNGKLPKDLVSFKELKCPRDYSIADPLLFEKDGKTFLFVEAIEHKSKNKGCIGVFDLSKRKPTLEIVIKELFHMSFPFVFEYNNQIYMIPETIEANQIILYKAVCFPYKWEKSKVLLDNIKAVDSVIYRSIFDDKFKLITELWKDEKYYFAAYNISPDNEFSMDLIYEACDNGKQMRNGGKIVFDNKYNKMYRITQDCQGLYGKKIIFREIINDNNEYKDVIIKTFDSNQTSIFGVKHKNYKQVHTYSQSQKYECIDYAYTGFSFRRFLMWLERFVNRHFRKVR